MEMLKNKELQPINIPEVGAELVAISDTIRIGRFERTLEWLDKAVHGAVVRRVAVTRGIQATKEDLMKVIDEWRQTFRLSKPEDVTAWLAYCNLSYEELETCLTEKVFKEKLIEMDILPEVDAYFKRNRFDFEAACLAQLTVKSKELAKEVLSQAIDDGIDFGMLVRIYSCDGDTRFSAGYIGWKRRVDLSIEVATAVFGGEEGDIIGPFRRGDTWDVYKIHILKQGILDPETHRKIVDLLWEEWVRKEIAEYSVTVAAVKRRASILTDTASSSEDSTGEGTA